MTDMTDINPAAEVAREKARTTAGQFGAQEHSAPETALPEVSARDLRIQKASQRLAELSDEKAALEAQVKAEIIGGIWETVPLEADAVLFDQFDSKWGEGLEFGCLMDADGNELTPEHDDEYRDAATWFSPDDIEYDPGYSGHVIAVGKDATRERIIVLEEEHRTGDSGRSGVQIGNDTDVAVTRYLRQLAAEHGWESIELGWDQEGREGLKVEAIVKDGKRRKAGSGHLDDHDAIWAAARYDRPLHSVMTSDSGTRGPFHLPFTS